MSHQPLIVIIGPTASGKSDLAMGIAKRYDGEIICADSRTVYKGMDIGTAKPTLKDRSKIPHYLIDIIEPNQSFSAADFKRLADEAIASIRSRGKLPILVGGTGLYVDSVIFDYKLGKPARDEQRARLQVMTIEELQQICRYTHIEMPVNSKNKRHLIRAIELDGLPKRKEVMLDDTFIVGISTENNELRNRIRLRAEAMIGAGVMDEIKRLSDRYGWESEAMTGNIYRVFRGVLEGTKTVEQAINECVTSDMALGKRQRTWFKRNPAIVWGDIEQLKKHIDDYIRAGS
jgi:tRNA dimethylallyltransferase